MKRAVFLDRDGVINRSFRVDGRPIPPRQVAEFRFLPGSRKHIRQLKLRGFSIVVVTNQPDVAKKLIRVSELDTMNRRVTDELDVDLVKVCMHAQDAGCACRKPAPGMLLEGAAELGVDLGRSYMVGDRWSDVEAGRAAGCYTIKIERRWANEKPSRPDATVTSLGAAVRHIMNREKAIATKRPGRSA